MLHLLKIKIVGEPSFENIKSIKKVGEPSILIQKGNSQNRIKLHFTGNSDFGITGTVGNANIFELYFIQKIKFKYCKLYKCHTQAI